MFMSAIFDPVKAVPLPWRTILELNPLVRFIEGARSAVIWGYPPNWIIYLLLMIVSLLIAFIGYLVFDRAKQAFADVI
jgi:lipopolysaccharide transport system permease protein